MVLNCEGEGEQQKWMEWWRSWKGVWVALFEQPVIVDKLGHKGAVQEFLSIDESLSFDPKFALH